MDRAPRSRPSPGAAAVAGPLVVVSNRLPFRAERSGGRLHFTRSPGGLVSALEPVLRERGGVWVGWPGIPREDLERATADFPRDPNVRYEPVPLSAHEVGQFYGAFSNRTLWPLFHYFVGTTRIDATAWRAYDAVNARFAERAAAFARSGALVWVHDYQLLRTPQHLRHLVPDARVALFLHIPFPATDVFRVLPWSRLILRGMLGADVVGFQVESYADHFLGAAARLLGCDVDRGTRRIEYDGRTISVTADPISIDAEYITRLAEKTGPRARHGEHPLEILGVDRLDYTKGIHERLLAVERLLERWPEYRRRIVFTQLMVPSRERVAEYSDLKRQIDETVGRINGRFSEGGWAPIRYLVRSLPPEELVPLYRSADVALVTPLRDGMNLVAKEYVMAQVSLTGVLVLSELAGAAEELQEALVVNPFDVDAVAAALHRALSMPADERHARMSALRDRVRTHDVHAWVRDFLAETDRAALRVAPDATPVEQVKRRLLPWLSGRPSVTVFLDYDGTLTPIVPRPEDATLSRAARAALAQAARNPALDVVIVSGRSLDDVKARGGVAGITCVGDHGFQIEGPGVALHHDGLERYRDVVERAADRLEAMAVPGAQVERKAATVSYHVRRVDEDARADAVRRAEQTLRRLRLRVTHGKMVVEGRPPLDWHKGQAVLYVLTQRYGANWPSRTRALYIGDDVTDEDAFQSLRGIGRSIHVSEAAPSSTSVADYRLPDPAAVIQLVRWLGAGAFTSPSG
ncbi:MAG TPA: bifunctional alpha,alpha-trehalose-phosphate synthase (UDP-forming)/trehalose-phosphatase [Gemmatimonadaceae bacterium]|nr:bifunctional alpha,alpha-trehalose-phosphate synthase (UDP-forming)/trehalose-phosphatase [Gemmatimonadaceae bacterium]